MAYVLANPIGVQILEALGLPSKQAMSLTLEFKTNAVVVARVEYGATVDGIHKVTELIREWRPHTDEQG